MNNFFSGYFSAVFLLLILGSSFNVNAQLSEELISDEVRVKMDENKTLGLELTNGIHIRFNLEFQGELEGQKQVQLFQALQNNLGATIESVSAEKFVIFEIPALYSLDDVKQIASPMNLGLGRLESISAIIKD